MHSHLIPIKTVSRGARYAVTALAFLVALLVFAFYPRASALAQGQPPDAKVYAKRSAEFPLQRQSQKPSEAVPNGGPAPANDNCTGAIVIPGAGPFPFLTATVDVTNAGFLVSDPIPTCIAGLDDNSIWYSFTPTVSGSYRVSTCSTIAPGSTVDDTVLTIFTGPCAGPLVEAACDDDSCTTENFQATLTATLTSGTTYLIYASCLSTPADPNDDIQIAIENLGAPATPTPGPTNDLCSGAEVIPPAGPFPHLTAITDVTLATTDAGDPAASCQPSVSRSIWYTFTPSATNFYRFSTCQSDAPGSTLPDDVITVYSSAGGCAGPFTQNAAGCDDDSCTTLGLQAVLDSTALNSGTRYYIVARKFGTTAPTAGAASIQMRVSIAPPPTPTPTATVSPGGTPTATPSATASASPSASPSATASPSASPTCAPSAWTAGGNFPTNAVRSTGVYFPANLRFYAMGGRSTDVAGSDFTTPFEYNPTTNLWAPKAAAYPDNQVNNMACGTLTVSGTPQIYCVGGSAAGATVATARVFSYNPVTDAITPLAAGDNWPGSRRDDQLAGGLYGLPEQALHPGRLHRQPGGRA